MGSKSIKLIYSIMKLNTICLPTKARPKIINTSNETVKCLNPKPKPFEVCGSNLTAEIMLILNFIKILAQLINKP
jgi:hypothetical protein